jgi:cyclopropane-fatty-acyl-phospholipid synthase
MRRAVEKYDVNVVGLTLSHNQLAHNQQKFDEMDGPLFREGYTDVCQFTMVKP